jgi:hypothetical protein
VVLLQLASDKGYITTWPEELIELTGENLTMISKYLHNPNSRLGLAVILLQTIQGTVFLQQFCYAC